MSLLAERRFLVGVYGVSRSDLSKGNTIGKHTPLSRKNYSMPECTIYSHKQLFVIFIMYTTSKLLSNSPFQIVFPLIHSFVASQCSTYASFPKFYFYSLRQFLFSFKSACKTTTGVWLIWQSWFKQKLNLPFNFILIIKCWLWVWFLNIFQFCSIWKYCYPQDQIKTLSSWYCVQHDTWFLEKSKKTSFEYKN